MGGSEKKCCEEKHVEGSKIHYVLIKDFKTFMLDHTLHRGRKYFCHHYLQAFSSEEILEFHSKGCSNIIRKQKIKISKKMNMLNSKFLRENQINISDFII